MANQPLHADRGGITVSCQERPKDQGESQWIVGGFRIHSAEPRWVTPVVPNISAIEKNACFIPDGVIATLWELNACVRPERRYKQYQPEVPVIPQRR